MNRWTAAGAAGLLLLLAWFFRFDVIATGATGAASAYVLDRWTGTVHLLAGTERHAIREGK